MLKPEKGQTVFDNDGKVLGFQKALKSIILGVGIISFDFSVYKQSIISYSMTIGFYGY